MTPARSLAVVVVGAGCAAATLSFACGDLGEPAFVGSQEAGPPAQILSPSSTSDAEEGESPARTPLTGTARDRETDAALAFALVAIEVGGLYQANPGALGLDGATLPTLRVNPFYRYGAMTDEAGAFALDVPSEPVGVHVYKSDFLCGVPEAGAILPGDDEVWVQAEPLSITDGGGEVSKPTIVGFTVTPAIVGPGETLTMSARVEAVDPATDPLSEQVLAVEPVSNWAGAFAPPEPGTEDAGFPNGIYSRLVPAPLIPGEYTYYLVAVTRACVVSEFATQKVTVTPTGEGGDDGAGEDDEAGE